MSTLLSKVKAKGKMLYATILGALMMAPVSTFAVNVKTNVTTVKVLGGVLDVIFDIALYVGIALAVSGVFQLILAYKDDNADGQSRAVRLVVVAIALIGLPQLIKLTGLIS